LPSVPKTTLGRDRTAADRFDVRQRIFRRRQATEGMSPEMPALRPSFPVISCCLAALLTVPCSVQAQTTPAYQGSYAKVLEFGERRPKSPRRVAVIGNVQRPGVYESTVRDATAGPLLKAAGSQAAAGDFLTRFHTGMTPVVVATWNAESALVVDGDVISVLIPPSRPRPAAADQIHVALLVGKDPVVVRVPRSDQTLPGLFSLLRQTSDAAASATVNGVRSNAMLENGDVIFVASNLIDRGALMSSPAVLPATSLDPPPEQPKATAEWSPPVTVPETPALPPLKANPLGEASQQASAVAKAKPETPDGDDFPKVAMVESFDPPVMKLEAPAVETRRASSAPVRRQPTRTTEPDPELEATAEEGSPVRTMVVLLALGTLGLGVALLWLASEKRVRGVWAPEPVEMPPPADAPAEEVEDELGQLIRGDLPVEDEPVVLPSRIALHGQAVGQKRLILHPPQSLAGPHFAMPPGSSAPAEKVAAAGPPVRPDPASSPIRSPRDTEGLLDRVLLAMQREGRR